MSDAVTLPHRLLQDILLVRMTSDSVKPVAQRYNYSNALSGFVDLVRSEGLKGLARGLGANTVRSSPVKISAALTTRS